MKPRTRLLVLMLAFAFFCAPAALAQAPGWSRGQQNLAITQDECMRRAPAALQAQGYRIDYNAGNFAVGIKDVHTAVIICSPAPDSKMFVQIVVASNGEGGGTERQQLQARMEQPGAPPTPGSGCSGGDSAVVGTWTWAYAPPGQSPVEHGTIKACADGGVTSSVGNSGTWRRSGNTVTLTWTNGSVDTLTLSGDGKAMTGTNNSGWNVKGTRQ